MAAHPFYCSYRYILQAFAGFRRKGDPMIKLVQGPPLLKLIIHKWFGTELLRLTIVGKRSKNYLINTSHLLISDAASFLHVVENHTPSKIMTFCRSQTKYFHKSQSKFDIVKKFGFSCNESILLCVLHHKLKLFVFFYIFNLKLHKVRVQE